MCTSIKRTNHSRELAIYKHKAAFYETMVFYMKIKRIYQITLLRYTQTGISFVGSDMQAIDTTQNFLYKNNSDLHVK